MDRRTALKFGAGAIVAGAGAYGGYQLLSLRPSRTLASVDDLARRLYVGLNDEQRAETCVAYDHPFRQYHNRGVSGGGRKKEALLAEAPIQTQIELQGRHGSFAGIPVAELTGDSKALTRDLVARILATYPPDDVAYARECLEANGGVDGLFLSYYQHG